MFQVSQEVEPVRKGNRQIQNLDNNFSQFFIFIIIINSIEGVFIINVFSDLLKKHS
jgi:hypothetical protein